MTEAQKDNSGSVERDPGLGQSEPDWCRSNTSDNIETPLSDRVETNDQDQAKNIGLRGVPGQVAHQAFQTYPVLIACNLATVRAFVVDLPETASFRARYLGALSLVSERLELSLDLIPADWRRVRQLLVIAATKMTFQVCELLDDVRFILTRCGAFSIYSTNPTQLDASYEQISLLAEQHCRLTDSTRGHFHRFLRWLQVSGYACSDVKNAQFEYHQREQEMIFRTPLARNQRSHITSIWIAIAALDGAPISPVHVFDIRRKRLDHGLDEAPPSFILEIDKLFAALAEHPNPSDENLPACGVRRHRALRHSTCKANRADLLSVLDAFRWAGGDISRIGSLGELTSKSNMALICAGYHQKYERVNPSHKAAIFTVIRLSGELGYLNYEDQLTRRSRINRIMPAKRLLIADHSNRMIRHYRDESKRRVLFRLSEVLKQLADASCNRESLRLLQCAVMLSIIADAPISSTLVLNHLVFKSSVIFKEYGDSVVILLSRKITHKKVDLEYHMSPHASAMIRFYYDKLISIGIADPTHLFVKPNNDRKKTVYLGQQFVQIMQEYTGYGLTLSQTSNLVSYIFLEQNPNNTETVRRARGHVSLQPSKALANAAKSSIAPEVLADMVLDRIDWRRQSNE